MPERVGHEGRLSGVVAWGAALTSTRANQTSPVRPRLRLAPKDHSTVCLDCVAGFVSVKPDDSTVPSSISGAARHQWTSAQIFVFVSHPGHQGCTIRL
jgi:hypothetical protein